MAVDETYDHRKSCTESRKVKRPVFRFPICWQAVLEDLMYLIEDSPFSLFLWLKNSGALGGGTVPEENLLTLDFAYVTDPRAMKREDRSGAGTVS